ncbi:MULTISPECIES: YihY family inner membrane protein [unclassified Halanaerobium]|uniref:YihY family inner membrane protein n=1 Tax=unclassified Halanaerobium TaxID=2641197 RepID=UPI000DF1946F|nr:MULTISPECIES: YihY family inner membrane protein [unclassified Halanaerobium]RCW41863.1 tRNA-processing RNAse BN [Halanaerobium sp. MA284_MarDTE_T2]RCW84234.1 tRNA-processing RNAse BN [Halanaerobium sp. DL-01]
MFTNIVDFFSEILTINWKLFIIRVYQKLKENDILIKAMGMVYITLLSIVPFFIFLFYIFTLFDFFGRIDKISSQIQNIILENLAAGTGESVIDYLEKYIYSADVEQLGAVSFFSLILLIVFMLARVEITFNQIWMVKEHRDIFKRFISFWTFITLGTFILTLLLSISLIFSEKYLGFWLNDSEADNSMVFNFIMFSSNFLIFIFAYYIIPNTEVEASSAVFAGTVSGILFILSKNLYEIYTKYFTAYSYQRQIYGSLSVIPFFLVWLYLVWLIILTGAVISNVFQYRSNLNYLTQNRNLKEDFQVLIPAAIIITLSKNFYKNNREGVGVSLREFMQKINFSPEIIEENLEMLQKTGYIVKSKDDRYFLSGPIDKINLYKLNSSRYISYDINIENIFLEPEMKKIYQIYKNGVEETLKKVELKSIL